MANSTDFWVFDSIRRAKDFQANDVAVPVVIQNHAGFVPITLLNRRTVENDAKGGGFGIASDFHGGSTFLT
jgi:hypothetical protein